MEKFAPDYSIIWLEDEDKPRLVASKWIIENEDQTVYCFLPSEKDKIKFNSALFKLKEVENSWHHKIVKKIKYRTDDFAKGKDKLLEALLHSDIDSQTSDYDKEFLKRTRKNRASQNLTLSTGKSTSNLEKEKSEPDSFPSMPVPIFQRPSESTAVFNPPSPNFQQQIKRKSAIVSNIACNSLILPCFKRPVDNQENEKIEIKKSYVFEPESKRLKRSSVETKQLAPIHSKNCGKQETKNMFDDIQHSDNATSVHSKTDNDVIEVPETENTSEDKQLAVADTLASAHLQKKTPLHRDKIQKEPADEGKGGTKKKSNEEKSSSNKAVQDKKSESKEKLKSLKPNMEKCLAKMTARDTKSGSNFERLLLDKVNEVLITLQMLVTSFDDLSLNSTPSTSDNFFESDKCPDLPITTQEKFDDFIKKIKNKRFFRQVTDACGKIGGKDLSSIITNICAKLVSNSVAVNYSWSGRKKPKLALKKTKVDRLIISAVRIKKSEATEKEIAELTSKWFAAAKKRLNREQNKENTVEEDDDDDNDKEEISDDENENPAPLDEDADIED